MIDVSPLTQMAQQQPVPMDTPRPLQPVQPVQAAQGAESEGPRDSGENGVGNAMLEQVIRSKDASMQFRIDREQGRIVVSILDADGEVIRQIPSDLILQLAQRIEEIQSKGFMSLDTRV